MLMDDFPIFFSLLILLILLRPASIRLGAGLKIRHLSFGDFRLEKTQNNYNSGAQKSERALSHVLW